jgi:hypothetical protein
MPSSIFAVFIRPSDAVTVIIPSWTAKASRNQFPLASRKPIFLGIGQLLAANTPATRFARPAMAVVQKVPSSN